jgi:hypothetical protein
MADLLFDASGHGAESGKLQKSATLGDSNTCTALGLVPFMSQLGGKAFIRVGAAAAARMYLCLHFS